MGGLKAFPVGGGKGRAGVTEGKGGRLSRGMKDGAPGSASDRRWRFGRGAPKLLDVRLGVGALLGSCRQGSRYTRVE
jgi:hypothetical protein